MPDPSCGTQDLGISTQDLTACEISSCSSKDQTQVPELGVWCLGHWTKGKSQKYNNSMRQNPDSR